ncbi:hypothetical protein ABW21_db0201139 [Orbilia brochopaga]|nr:hypothetical protein ABW21_db0201139 [Drechslerella brochopaga]
MADDSEITTLDDALWRIGVHDAHCHPTDTMDIVPQIPSRRIHTLTIMATRAEDQALVAQVAREYGVDATTTTTSSNDNDGSSRTCRVVPSFGWHPWYTHLLLDDMSTDTTTVIKTKTEHYASVLTGDPTPDFIDSLPDPTPLSSFIASTRERLLEFSSALVGEVGIDRTFRLPYPDTAIPASGKKLSPYKVTLDHQRRILEHQLRLAGELNRPASLHGVGAHGVLHDVLSSLFRGYEKPIRSKRTQKRGPHDFAGDESSDSDSEEKKTKGPPPFPPRICLHSFSAPPDFLNTWLSERIPAQVFFSFSRAINVGYGYDKFSEMLRAVPERQLLVESDLHVASEQMEQDLAVIIRKIAGEKGWELERTVRVVGKNWRRFVYGDDGEGGESN